MISAWPGWTEWSKAIGWEGLYPSNTPIWWPAAPSFTIIVNKITKVVHGFSDKTDIDKQKEFFKVPMDMNIFFNIGYYDKISTTSIIQKIKLEY